MHECQGEGEVEGEGEGESEGMMKDTDNFNLWNLYFCSPMIFYNFL